MNRHDGASTTLTQQSLSHLATACNLRSEATNCIFTSLAVTVTHEHKFASTAIVQRLQNLGFRV